MGSGEDDDCHNIDECKLQIHSCGEKGDKGTYCRDNDGSYDCFCLHGFHMAESGRCENTNECLEGLVLKVSASYANLAEPLKIVPMYGRIDFLGLSTLSQTIKDQHLCNIHAVCIDLTPDNLNPRYRCKCNLGYSGDGFNCLNIDECITSTVRVLK